MSKKILVTTTIPYVNGQPHLGHALEFVHADGLARRLRLENNSSVRLQSGSDDNATKNVLAARSHQIKTEEYVAKNSQIFKNLLDSLDIQYDYYVQTSSQRHFETVNTFLSRLNPNDIYQKEYVGLYCNGCEEFVSEIDLDQGFCKDHQTKPETIKEVNYFFRLSNYQKQIENIYAENIIDIQPASRKKEILNFIESGLEDICLTRSSDRTYHWGIPSPWTPTQTVYVWIDALINYITGSGFDIWQQYDDITHVIGKNVWKFHAVYWPALLRSADLRLPSKIFIHGFLTENGNKISKSGTTGINLQGTINKFGSEVLRYYFFRYIQPQSDYDISLERLGEIYRNDLQNGIGNLTSRILALAKKFDVPTEYFLKNNQVCINENYSFQELDLIFNSIRQLDKEISDAAPWKKQTEVNVTKEKISRWIIELHILTKNIEIFLPNTSTRLKDLLLGTCQHNYLFSKLT